MVRPVYLLDTSALFKRYVTEKGSDIIEKLFHKKENIYIAELTLCEMLANLRRLTDVDKLITEEEFFTLREVLLADAGEENFLIIEFSNSILLKSLDICSRSYVSPLDAIQLATALSLSVNTVFVCADQKLLKVAQQYGLAVLNPELPASG